MKTKFAFKIAGLLSLISIILTACANAAPKSEGEVDIVDWPGYI